MLKKRIKIYNIILLAVLFIFTSCKNADYKDISFNKADIIRLNSLDNIPNYIDKPYVEINNNIPFFNEEDFYKESFEIYSELDELGRCGPAFAKIEEAVMPTKEREGIGMIKPSGWQTVRYDNIIDGNYLYNRCHLIAYMLAGENANEKNLITGTRYLNVQGMLPFENEVADYVNYTKDAVLYRVTPIFEDDNLIASGVVMEAASVKDKGKSLSFNVYVYNIQPGITINYRNGNSSVSETSYTYDDSDKEADEYVINKKSKKFHETDCTGVKKIKKENLLYSHISRDELLRQGYEPCKICNP